MGRNSRRQLAPWSFTAEERIYRVHGRISLGCL